MSSSASEASASEQHHWKPQAISTSICLTATVMGWALPHLGVAEASLPALLVAYASGGWESFLRTTKALRRLELDVDLLMLIAAFGAAIVGHWIEGAILLFLFSLGNTLETFAFGQTRRSIRALMELRPEEASIVEEDGERTVPIDLLTPGVIVRVRPGERIPIDGELVAGSSRVDESTLTGEATPVHKEVGDEVFAGTLNEGGSFDVRTTRPASDTQLARVITLVEQAQEARAPTQSWIEEVEGRYAAAVILGSALAIVVPWVFLGWSFHDALYRGMTLLVVASPCALVISVPATVVSAVSNGARHGILFKGGAHLDALATIRVAAFDKTGTLTVGRPEVVGVRTGRELPVAVGAGGSTVETTLDDRLVTLAAAAESRSEHPLGAAILREAERRGCSVPEPDRFDSSPGHGVRATVDGSEVLVGRRSWIEDEVGSMAPDGLTGLFVDSLEGATPVYVAVDGQHAGAIAVADTPRPGAREVLHQLAALGIEHSAMLTGDAHPTAHAIGREVGMTDIHAELLPDQKSGIIEELRLRYGPVAMIGDGVNDAPALASADLGIAVGAAGSDVALETADVVVLGEDLSALTHAVALSHRTRRIVRQNLIFAVSVMVTLVGLAAFGLIGLTTGVIGHEGSTVVVVFNGLRLLADGSTGRV